MIIVLLPGQRRGRRASSWRDCESRAAEGSPQFLGEARQKRDGALGPDGSAGVPDGPQGPSSELERRTFARSSAPVLGQEESPVVNDPRDRARVLSWPKS